MTRRCTRENSEVSYVNKMMLARSTTSTTRAKQLCHVMRTRSLPRLLQQCCASRRQSECSSQGSTSLTGTRTFAISKPTRLLFPLDCGVVSWVHRPLTPKLSMTYRCVPLRRSRSRVRKHETVLSVGLVRLPNNRPNMIRDGSLLAVA